MVRVGAVMAPALNIPDPATNQRAPKNGFRAQVAVGTQLLEEVLLVHTRTQTHTNTRSHTYTQTHTHTHARAH